MKKTRYQELGAGRLLVLILLTLAINDLVGQAKFDVGINTKNPEVLCLEYQGDNFARRYINGDIDLRETGTGKAVFTQVYINWLNPLRYRVTWSEEYSVDPRDLIVQDFFSAALSQIGLQAGLSTQPQAAPGASIGMHPSFKKSWSGAGQKLGIVLETHTSGVNSWEQENKVALESIEQSLKAIETQPVKNMSKEILVIFKELFEVGRKEGCKKTISKAKKWINNSTTYLQTTEQQLIAFQGQVNSIKVSADVQQRMLIMQLNDYATSTSALINSTRVLVAKLVKIVEFMEVSANTYSVELDGIEYVLSKNVAFDNGQILNTTVSITHKELDEERLEIRTTDKTHSAQVRFERKENVRVFASAGLFYGTTALKQFGVGTGSKGEMIVTETTSDEGSPVTAAFLNFEFEVSRYFAPVIQFGIDPTKTRPFFLAGAGISIPAASIALTAGPLWTWKPELTKLEVGGPVESTSVLQEDISYKFSTKPKGWYLGIQYNF